MSPHTKAKLSLKYVSLSINLAFVSIISATTFPLSSSAAVLRFNFNGQRTSGNILFNTAVPDQNPDPIKGLFRDAILDYDITIDGTPNTLSGVPVVTSLQGRGGDIVIGIGADGIGGCGLTIDCVNFFLDSSFPSRAPSEFELSLFYERGSLNLDDPPKSVPETGRGLLQNSFSQFFLGTDTATEITTESPKPIPEPSNVIGVVLALGFGVSLKKYWLRKSSGAATHK